ncbi:MAG: HNH endonuclease [Flavobacteriales bacterium]
MPRYIRPLPPQQVLQEIFKYDKETGNLWRYGKLCNNVGNNGYITVSINKETFLGHRVIWKLVTGVEPRIVDHLNHTRADNRWANLRNVSDRENNRNSPLQKRNKSGAHGVSWNKKLGKWRVRANFGGKRYYFGAYSNLEEAVKVRKEKQREFGYHPNHGT